MRRVLLVLVVLAIAAPACGDDAGKAGEAVEERVVLVDHRHDEFTSAFLRYYPEQVKVRPGDAVRFKQAWTGEPHSVTMGKVVDQMFGYSELLAKFDSPEEAREGGVTEETIAEVNATFARIPPMVGEGNEVYQPGAQPCYIGPLADVPEFSNPETEENNEDAVCPTEGRRQPAFTGRQAFYNSGFIPADGPGANTFVLPVAEDAEPGTYKYFCNYHWISMSGTIEVVAADTPIPSQQQVSRQARQEIEEDAAIALDRVEEAKRAKGGKLGDLQLPLAGREADEEYAAIINEFLPAKIRAKVGAPVTWTFDGIDHTVSFNVPKYFPIFRVKDDGEVEWNPQSYEPVGWEVPPKPEGEEDGPPGPPTDPRHVDVGEWNGKGGFRSSGALSPGERFTVTFTRSGTYAYACVLHPQMIGTVVVE